MSKILTKEISTQTLCMYVCMYVYECMYVYGSKNLLWVGFWPETCERYKAELYELEVLIANFWQS